MAISSVYFVLRMSIGIISLWAGLAKVRHLGEFRAGIAHYDLVPKRLIRASAIAIALSEIVVGVSLLAALRPAAGALGASTLFAMFAVAMAINLVRRNHIPCSCFGVDDSETITPTTLTRTMLLFGASVFALGLALQQPAVPPISDILPLLTVSAGLLVLARLAGFLPAAWSYLRARPTQVAAKSRRQRFRHQGLEVSLRSSAASNLTGTPIVLSGINDRVGTKKEEGRG